MTRGAVHVIASTLLMAIAAVPPSHPASIRLETVTYPGDSATFVATLACPDRPGRVPAVVLLHGSEPGRRDGEPARRLRERLVPQGIAVLSFDKRGVGGSSGRYQEMPDLQEAAGDGLAAVRFLVSRPEIDTTRIGVLGASQGGWVGPLMAALSPRIAFVVCVSGAGVTPGDQSRFEDGARLLEAGMDSSAVAEADSLRGALYAYWEGGADADSARALWRAALARPWFDAALRDDSLFSRLGRIESPPSPGVMPREFIELLRRWRYDPVATAERVRIPVLHVYGEGDRHVPVAESVHRLKPAYERAGNRDVTFIVFPHAGHGLQIVAGDAECLQCPPDTRSAPTFAPGAWERIDRWVIEHTRMGSGK